jgi:hypothetical protein
MLDRDWDYLFRKYPVIGAIALVIIVVGCAYTIVTSTTNVLSLLPAVLALLVLLAGLRFARRFVASLPEPTEPGPEVVEAKAAADIWDAYRQRQEALSTDLRQRVSEPAPEAAPVNGLNKVAPLSGRERFTLCIAPGALGGATVVLAITLLFFFGDQSPHPAGQLSLNDVSQVLGLCMLPLSVLGGAWFGSVSGSGANAVAARLGYRAKVLDVVIVCVAAITGVVVALIVAGFSLLAIIM